MSVLNSDEHAKFEKIKHVTKIVEKGITELSY